MKYFWFLNSLKNVHLCEYKKGILVQKIDKTKMH